MEDPNEVSSKFNNTANLNNSTVCHSQVDLLDHIVKQTT